MMQQVNISIDKDKFVGNYSILARQKLTGMIVYAANTNY